MNKKRLVFWITILWSLIIVIFAVRDLITEPLFEPGNMLVCSIAWFSIFSIYTSLIILAKHLKASQKSWWILGLVLFGPITAFLFIKNHGNHIDDIIRSANDKMRNGPEKLELYDSGETPVKYD